MDLEQEEEPHLGLNIVLTMDYSSNYGKLRGHILTVIANQPRLKCDLSHLAC